MHTLSIDNINMHFNTDLSGSIKIEIGGDQKFEIPGELIRQYVRRYVLGPMRDEFQDVLFRKLVGYGGKNSADYAMVLENIDNLAPISELTDNTAVLHGTTYLFGDFVHIEFLRVLKHRDRWVTEDPAYQEELEHIESAARAAGADGPLNAISVPGYTGDYIAFTYPYTE